METLAVFFHEKSIKLDSAHISSNKQNVIKKLHIVLYYHTSNCMHMNYFYVIFHAALSKFSFSHFFYEKLN